MKITNLQLRCFRNITALDLAPCPFINVIYGDNAQGKTNLMEAIWLFSGNNSFRGAKQNELIQFDHHNSLLSLQFEDSERLQKAEIELFSVNTKKKIKLNNVEMKGFSELSGNFLCVVFSPTHLSLVKDGPKNRRRFLDIAISQIKPQYKNYLASYEKLIEQRNALVKTAFRNTNLQSEIDVWDVQLAKIGTIITIYRNDYLKKLVGIAKKLYKGISSQKEELSLCYSSTVYENSQEIKIYDENSVNAYYQKLKRSFETDTKQGFTTCGIHRDDLEIYIDGRSIKTYGSQGQQRSSVITLKLSEARLLFKITNENPIILLDDVMSELDESRQDFILNHVKDMQVFITCCDINNTMKLSKGRIFKISKGQIVTTEEV